MAAGAIEVGMLGFGSRYAEVCHAIVRWAERGGHETIEDRRLDG